MTKINSKQQVGAFQLLLKCFNRRQATIMSAQVNKDNVDDVGLAEYPKAQRENGVFILPWSGRLTGMLSAMKWFMTSPNNSNVPGNTLSRFYTFDNQELDQTLPVLKPVKKTLESPPADNVQVTWMGHATVLVQMDGLNILTDPVFNDYCGVARMIGVKRYRPVPCTVDDLPDIDAVCISHNHYDHLDYTSVCALNKRFGNKIHWFVPMGLRQWMRDSGCKNVIELEWWEEHSHPKFTEESKAVKFCFTPAQHWCRRGINDTNKVLWGSWSVIGPRNRFFFAGDTGYHQIFKQIGRRYGPFDLAAIPIGAYEPRGLMQFQHVNPEEAVDIHEDVKSNFSLGVHWGTFNLSYEEEEVFEGKLITKTLVGPIRVFRAKKEKDLNRIVLMNWTRDLAMPPCGIRMMLLKSIRNLGYRKLQPEHYLDPPKALSERLLNLGISDKEFNTIKHGETKVITKDDTKTAQERRNAVVFETST